MAGEIELVTARELSHIMGQDALGYFGLADWMAFLRQTAMCEVPEGLGWDHDNYPIERVGYRELGGGQRKGVVEGYTPFSTEAGTPYHDIRNGREIYVDGLTGSDSSGTGTLSNPYKFQDKAIREANAGGQPTTIWYKARYGITRGNGGQVPTAPTVPICHLLYGGTHNIGNFDTIIYTAAADFPGCYQMTGVNTSGLYDRNRFDEFGLFKEYAQLPSGAACQRTAGSLWYDVAGNRTVFNTFDGAPPTDSSVLRTIDFGGAVMFDKSYAYPVHTFWDTETEGDRWEIWGNRLALRANAYASTPQIGAIRRVNVKYASFRNSDARNGIACNNWNGLFWVEDCYVGGAGYDSLNGHNTLNTEACSFLSLNCKADKCGVVGPADVASQNHWAIHENIVGMDIAGDYDYARGGTLRLGASRALFAGTRARRDRGDLNVIQTTGNPGTEVFVGTGGIAYLFGCDLQPMAGGSAILCRDVGGVRLRAMPALRGRVIGLPTEWE